MVELYFSAVTTISARPVSSAVAATGPAPAEPGPKSPMARSAAGLLKMRRAENCLRCVIDPYLASEVLIHAKKPTNRLLKFF